MEHSVTSTLVREPEVEYPLDQLPNRRDTTSTPIVRERRITRWRRRITSEAGIVILLATPLYLVVGILLDFKYLSFNGDAMARMANGFYILYSRDRHLAAIGFVWNPLQSILDLGPLLFYHLWTPLASRDFAGSLVSVACMVGAVHQVRAALFEWGVRRSAQTGLDCALRTQPNDLLLQRYWYERSLVSLHVGGNRALSGPLAPQPRHSLSRLCGDCARLVLSRSE